MNKKEKLSFKDFDSEIQNYFIFKYIIFFLSVIVLGLFYYLQGLSKITFIVFSFVLILLGYILWNYYMFSRQLYKTIIGECISIEEDTGLIGKNIKNVILTIKDDDNVYTLIAPPINSVYKKKDIIKIYIKEDNIYYNKEEKIYHLSSPILITLEKKYIDKE